MLSSDLSSHLEPSVAVPYVYSSLSFDSVRAFDGGGSMSGGGGADGSL